MVSSTHRTLSCPTLSAFAAVALGRELPSTLAPAPVFTAAVHEDVVVREDGKWKYASTHAYNPWTARYSGGWVQVYPFPYPYPNPVSGR